MGISYFVTLVLGLSSISAIADCSKENPNDPIIYSSDFIWDYTLPQLKNKFSEMYVSPKRLKNRAYIDEKTREIILPSVTSQGGPIVITNAFVENIANHIEQGFEKGIVDAVFFPDMGHSHFFIPQEKFDNVYSKFEPNQFNLFYQKLFADPDLKILYHTVEQLKFRDENGELIQDPAIIGRYQTRNLVGTNQARAPIFNIQNPESNANTARELPGHHYWGAGFNLSANQNGCFSYTANGQIYFFDLSMYDLESSDTGGDF
jgi:hypothetical protein